MFITWYKMKLNGWPLLLTSGLLHLTLYSPTLVQTCLEHQCTPFAGSQCAYLLLFILQQLLIFSRFSCEIPLTLFTTMTRVGPGLTNAGFGWSLGYERLKPAAVEHVSAVESSRGNLWHVISSPKRRSKQTSTCSGLPCCHEVAVTVYFLTGSS